VPAHAAPRFARRPDGPPGAQVIAPVLQPGYPQTVADKANQPPGVFRHESSQAPNGPRFQVSRVGRGFGRSVLEFRRCRASFAWVESPPACFQTLFRTLALPARPQSRSHSADCVHGHRDKCGTHKHIPHCLPPLLRLTGNAGIDQPGTAAWRLQSKLAEAAPPGLRKSTHRS
jgi:hypothetical protein